MRRLVDEMVYAIPMTVPSNDAHIVASAGPSAPTVVVSTDVTIDAGGIPFDDFYEQNIRKLAGALGATIQNRELAIDAAQEAMVRACERWAKVSTYDNPMGWCYRVGLNWATSRFRKLRRESLVGHHAVDALGTDTIETANDALRMAIEKLPLKQRSVIVLRFWMGMNTNEIADALDIPPGTVSSRMSRALEALQVHAKDAR